MMRRSLLHMLPLLILAIHAEAASTLTDVAPQSLGQLALGIRIESETREDSTVRFDIFVTSGSDSISPRREGRLEVYREAVVPKGVGKNPPFQPPLLWCNVNEMSEDGVLHFTFGLPADWLRRACFQFRNYDPRGHPSMDVYRVLLKEFVRR